MTLTAVLAEVGATMMLRVQFERDATVGEDYRENFGLTEERVRQITRVQ